MFIADGTVVRRVVFTGAYIRDVTTSIGETEFKNTPREGVDTRVFLGNVATIAGTPFVRGFKDGDAAAALFGAAVAGLAFRADDPGGGAGTLFIADHGNSAVRQLEMKHRGGKKKKKRRGRAK